MNKDLRDYGEEINKFHRRQKWGGVQHVDVVEGERENNWWQGERGRREWEGLYDGCDNWIGRMTKLVSILATLSEEKGFSNFCYLFILYCSSCKKLVSTYYPSFLFPFCFMFSCHLPSIVYEVVAKLPCIPIQRKSLATRPPIFSSKHQIL